MLYRYCRFDRSATVSLALLLKISQEQCVHLTPFFSIASALFCATESSQPLSHESLPHSCSCNGGGGALPIFHFPFSIVPSTWLPRLHPSVASFVFIRLRTCQFASSLFSNLYNSG